MASVNADLWDNYDGRGFAAEYSKYSVRASKDENGNNIMSTYATKAEVTEKQDALPSPTINDSLLLGQADGSETWTALENDVFGTRLPDEETGKPMYDASSTDQLWTGFAGKKFGAARAVADQDGNVFGETYARKLLPATKAFAASVTVDNNRVTSITGVTGSVAIDITVAPGECANTAVELTTGSSVTADSAVTVTVNGVAAGRAAATDGKISASKKYQVTCVGTCWTMAEFETANA